jgi:hypothetical protein
MTPWLLSRPLSGSKPQDNGDVLTNTTKNNSLYSSYLVFLPVYKDENLPRYQLANLHIEKTLDLLL